MDRAQRGWQPARDLLGGSVHDDVDGILPARGEMTLERRHGVEVGGRGEAGVEDVDGAHSVDAVGTHVVDRGRMAEQIPPSVSYDDGPGLDLRGPGRAGL